MPADTGCAANTKPQPPGPPLWDGSGLAPGPDGGGTDGAADKGPRAIVCGHNGDAAAPGRLRHGFSRARRFAKS